MPFDFIKKGIFYFKIFTFFLMNKKAGDAEYVKDYDIISDTYDDLWTARMGKYTKEMLNLIAFNDNYVFLDLACGTGFVIEEALKKGKPLKIIGVDGSKDMLKKAALKIKSGDVEFLKGNILSEIKKLPDNFFDIVSFCWAFSYINRSDRDGLLENIHRVLKPGGILAVIANRKGTINNIEDAFVELMEKNHLKINKISDIRFNLIKNCNQLKRMFVKNKFVWINGWDKEESFTFNNGTEAIKWVRDCGAIAGTFELLDINNLWGKLAEIFEKKYKKGEKLKITHKFSVGIVKKC